MIIKREYVPFCVLFDRDKEARMIFEKAFNASYPKIDRKRIMKELLPQCSYQKDMGWCFNKIGDVIDGFERLDKEKPYDNGLTYNDVNEIQIVSKEEQCLVLHLICRFDGIDNIVQVVECNH